MADIPPPTAKDVARDLAADYRTAALMYRASHATAIRRALYAEAEAARMRRERDAAEAEASAYRQALDSIAEWDDAAGNRTLAERGRYTSFDYPEAVRKAREALAAVNAMPTGGVE